MGTERTRTVTDQALCPRCGTRLGADFACASCRQAYPAIASVRVLLPDPSGSVALWRAQLGLIIQQASETNRSLQLQAAEAGLGDATRTRLRALARAIAEQVADIAAVLIPVLGDPQPPPAGVGLPRGAGDYLSCLFRDWAWAGHDEENDRSRAAIRRVAGGRPLGRTLVLGAGGCRLAYDLHIQCGGSQTAVVDIDPFLLVLAEAVVRGATVSLTETSVNAPEVDPVSRAWALTAPSGPLGRETFHFFLADGTEPPFGEQTFDTVVTPWFVDQVPTDLGAFLRRVHGLLVPGGRWINHGPLIYRPDVLPVARWYARQEIFDLATTIGFRVGAWESAPQPHFASPLTGRGLIEHVLTFEAVRS